MTEKSREHLAFVRRYLRALEDGAAGEALARFFTADAVQVELPNRLNPSGGTSDLATLLQRAERMPSILRSQSYEVRSELAQHDRVAIEVLWKAVLAVPLGSLSAGAAMTAHFAVFFELRDGLIASQRNYDCFEPW